VMRRDGTRAVVSGPATLADARSLLEEGRAQLKSGVRAIDLAGVTELDSSLLAVLLAWQREARAANITLAVEGLPEGLVTIARLYGVEDILSGGAQH